MAVTLTERAAKEIKRLMSEKQLSEQSILCLAVAGGGCSGFEYRMNFADDLDEAANQVDESHGVRVAVDAASQKFLEGTEVDFLDDLINRGFVFNNPNAVKTCGCGTSFGV